MDIRTILTSDQVDFRESAENDSVHFRNENVDLFNNNNKKTRFIKGDMIKIRRKTSFRGDEL